MTTTKHITTCYHADCDEDDIDVHNCQEQCDCLGLGKGQKLTVSIEE